MTLFRNAFFAFAVVVCLSLVGAFAAAQHTAQLPPPKIDLTQVGVAFAKSSGKTRMAWFNDFEWRVNQIYLGRDIVSLSIVRSSGIGWVHGYIERNGKPGRQLRDELLFGIRLWRRGKTHMYFDVVDHIGWAGYSHTYVRAGGPGFISVFTGPRWRPYHTQRQFRRQLRRQRRLYRQSKRYRQRERRFRAFVRRASRDTRRALRYRRRMRRRRGGKW